MFRKQISKLLVRILNLNPLASGLAACSGGADSEDGTQDTGDGGASNSRLDTYKDGLRVSEEINFFGTSPVLGGYGQSWF